MDKLITFAVPCYNSAAYMEHCVETLLQGGDDIEIILVDDGSTKDDTPAICDRYQEQYPDIVRAIHQANGGHGEGVNQGIRNARGFYYKVVDSDDWVDVDALHKAAGQAAPVPRDDKPGGHDDRQLRLRARGGPTPRRSCDYPTCSPRTGSSAGTRSAASVPPSTC